MSRLLILENWLEKVFNGVSYRLWPLAGDASFRRYYRVEVEEKPFVLMDAPIPENPKLFKELALVLQGQGLSVPEVFEAELTEGILLLSDLGDRLYLNDLNEKTAPELYQDALNALVQLQGCQAEIPTFDRNFLKREMDIFKEWYLERHLNVHITATLQSLIEDTFSLLVEVLEEQPYVFVHRDYHSRNLMILEKGNPGILDFQDAMWGPITYDLVSLLQDCYISWPRQQVVGWAKDFKNSAIQANRLKNPISDEAWIRWFDFTGAQRHLKNLGIFSRLHHRDGKPHYLKNIPTPLNNILQTSIRYPELKPLSKLMQILADKGAF